MHTCPGASLRSWSPKSASATVREPSISPLTAPLAVGEGMLVIPREASHYSARSWHVSSATPPGER
eukprot:6723789-Heterocapsa_arctica.AAC.1